MSQTRSDTDRNDREYRAALRRCTGILDMAAEKEHVSPDEFRAAIHEAITHTNVGLQAGDLTAEAFLLSLITELF